MTIIVRVYSTMSRVADTLFVLSYFDNMFYWDTHNYMDSDHHLNSMYIYSVAFGCLCFVMPTMSIMCMHCYVRTHMITIIIIISLFTQNNTDNTVL